jgi:hypothetical protein
MKTNYDRLRNSWAILPAAQCLFGKTKVTLDEIAKEWPSGTVVVCKKDNGQFHFIAGASGSYAKVGDRVEVHHDQTLSRIGTWTVVNEIVYETVSGGVNFAYAQMPALGENLVLKAAMAVFK